VVPVNRFDKFINRLTEIKKNRELYGFLASRCSSEFLSRFLETRADVAEAVTQPNSPLGLAPEVAVLRRLQEFALLQEPRRLRFVSRARELAVETPDLDMFSVESVRHLFTTQELSSLRQLLCDELVPALDGLIEGLSEAYDDKNDPDEWFGELSEVLNTLAGELADNPAAIGQVALAQKRIARTVRSLQEGSWRPEEPDDDRRSYGGGTPSEAAVRDVFDDVDQ
jgi:hypothetical protein